MGPDVLDQQVSCLWQNNYLLSVSLSGFINYLDVNNPSTPLRIVKGHNRTITALSVDTASEEKRIYTGSCDGFITQWNPKNGDHDRIGGKGHSNQISGLVFDGTGKMYSVGYDDITRAIDVSSNQFDASNEFKLDQQPHGVALTNDGQLMVVACHSTVQVRRVRDGGILCSVPAPYEPSSVSVNFANNDVAIGGVRDSKVHVYGFDGQKLTEKTIATIHREGITEVVYSPDGKYLAAADQNRKIVLYLTENYQVTMLFLIARVRCLRFLLTQISLLARARLGMGLSHCQS